MADMTDDPKAATEKLGKLIQGVKFAMMTTAEPDGSLRSRPMATQDTDHTFDGTLWFFTREHSGKVDELGRDHHVNLSYADASKQTYVSVSGTASLVKDKQKIEQLWSIPMKAWFPKGTDDPELALIRVDVHKAEFWDTASSAMVHLIGLVKATLTGKPHKPGDHAKVDLD